MATETMAIIEAGRFRSPNGREVEIAAGVRAAVAATRLHLPVEKIPAPLPQGTGRAGGVPRDAPTYAAFASAARVRAER